MQFVGKYCIVRTRSGGAGVHFGIVRELVGMVVHLDKSRDGEPSCAGPRRLWSWSEHFTLTGVALHGPGNMARISEPAPDGVYLSEACEVLPVTEEARKLLEKR